jgi:hypothetical protein
MSTEHVTVEIAIVRTEQECKVQHVWRGYDDIRAKWSDEEIAELGSALLPGLRKKERKPK